MIIKRVVGSILGISLLATSVALIGAAAAPYVDPIRFDWFAFLGLMYPFLLLLHLILFVVYFLVKRNKKSLLFLVPALLTTNNFLNSFGLHFSQPVAATQGDTLKFMTYNVHMFRAANNLDEIVAEPMLQLIQDESPDVLCVQDLQTDQKTIDSVKHVLNTDFFYNGPRDMALFPTTSIGTFSKYPIVNTGYILLSQISFGNQSVFTDINKNGKIFRVYNVHFESLGFQPYEYEEWQNGNILGKFEFLFKVKDKFSKAFANRSEQVKILKNHADTCPYPYIIAGDFNDTPSSFAVNYTMRDLKNTFREKGSGYTVTFNGGLPDFQIDYVFVKPFFTVLDYNVIRKKLSDHYPVVTKLALQ